ncbi:MAG: stage IV sporulation protein A [Oscillospiraceae bacterium]|nr:stage IV sporulation protein A [Oscillospiraceae bacterium]
MSNLYADIAERTGGDIYIGVVGPVRTGKSTFIKRLMEVLVIPHIDDLYQRERAKDELPQSGSGKTIMTAEPKFVPEEAVQITPDGTATLSVRLIDSVGYMVDGAIGATENGAPRMVTTPWFDEEIPMTEAAELGTKKVMEEHCTVGIVVTTDGTVTDIPRGDYIAAEERAIRDMQATGKPFLVLINSAQPNSAEATALRDYIAQTYRVSAVTADCQAMQEAELNALLKELLYAFPMREMRVFLPAWVQALEVEHPLKAALYQALRTNAEAISRLAEAEIAIARVAELEDVCGYRILSIDLGSGTVTCELDMEEGLFYQILGQRTGFEIENDGQLLSLLTALAEMKKQYDKISAALEEVRATGYGIVMPSAEELKMEVPEIVRKGNSYGVKLKASAPSIHLLRADIQTEISPMVGDEQQSEELVKYLLGEYEGNTEKLWDSNIFGKSVFELVNEGLTTKLRRMPDDARYKLKDALTKIINEGANGLICLLI